MALINCNRVIGRDTAPNRLVRAAGDIASISARHRVTLFTCLFAVAAGIAEGASPQSTSPPDFGSVSQAVQLSLLTRPDYQPGDLISCSDVEAALDGVSDAGWEVADRGAILDRALPDNSFLVAELSARKGKKFMRRVAKEPGNYARLDRLASLPRGKAIVRDLVRGKNGDEFVEYLATTKSGKNLGHMLGGSRQGVDLNKPTGRIYTAADLLGVLQAEYVEAFP
jgi:hypothetical protein